jgi:formate dehydrogenase assembly factor FdhD
LYAAEHNEWVEKAFITRLWMSVSRSETTSSPDEIVAVLDALVANMLTPMDTAASHAAQIVSKPEVSLCGWTLTALAPLEEN